jgi:hypothetical protein
LLGDRSVGSWRGLQQPTFPNVSAYVHQGYDNLTYLATCIYLTLDLVFAPLRDFFLLHVPFQWYQIMLCVIALYEKTQLWGVDFIVATHFCFEDFGGIL